MWGTQYRVKNLDLELRLLLSFPRGQPVAKQHLTEQFCWDLKAQYVPLSKTPILAIGATHLHVLTLLETDRLSLEKTISEDEVAG